MYLFLGKIFAVIYVVELTGSLA